MAALVDLYLIRHAESTANAGLPTESPESVPLTLKGEAQAAALAQALSLRPARLLHSPFVRAIKTAEPLIARHPQAMVESCAIQEFTYLNPGTWRGTTAEQRWPAVDAYWLRAQPEATDGPDTESFAGLLARADQFITRFESAPAGPILAVSHGIFICAVLWQLRHAGEPPDMAGFRQFQRALVPLNTAVTRLQRLAGGWQISPSLMLRPKDMPPL